MKPAKSRLSKSKIFKLSLVGLALLLIPRRSSLQQNYSSRQVKRIQHGLSDDSSKQDNND